MCSICTVYTEAPPLLVFLSSMFPSADHGAVDSELSATESERQLSDSLHHGGPELSLLTTEATLGLFDDLLKDDDNNDDDDSAADTDSDATQDDEVFTAALHLHMSPTHSETTSLASTRFGSYEVNPSEHLSPVFFPPPPPESPPPPVSETGCDLDSDQGQERGCNHDNDPGTHDSDKDTEDEETLDGLLDWVADGEHISCITIRMVINKQTKLLL